MKVGVFYSEFFYGGTISYTGMMEPSVTVDLCGGEKGFIFPCLSMGNEGSKMLTLP